MAENSTSRRTERDWIEDYTDENGCYFHMCNHCNEDFYGNKRRLTMCKKCWVKWAGDFITSVRRLAGVRY